MDDLPQVAVVFCLLFTLTGGYPSGPPVTLQNVDVCKDMNPGVTVAGVTSHGVQAQSGEDAVNITLGNDCYKKDEKILVTVDFNKGSTFKGIFVQARKTSGEIKTNDPLGTFEAGGGDQEMKMQAYDCNNDTSSAWGHKEALTSGTVKFNWKAPSNQGEVKFVMTVVEEKVKFWTFQKSTAINYCSSASSISAVTYALVTILMGITSLLR